MLRVLALILAGGTGDRLSILSAERAKPAVPFGGRYRIIDFALSNCVNAGIYNVGVITQYNPRSLSEHIGIGRPWGLDRGEGGLRLLQPYRGRSKGGWYRDTGDAVYQNLYFVAEQKVDQVLILGGDHIYTMRYDHMITSHRQRDADITVGVAEVAPSEVSRFGIISLDHMDRVTGFEEKPAQSNSTMASMGIYVFNKDVLVSCLEATAGKEKPSDFGGDIIPRVIGKYNIFGCRFQGYWRDVGTIEAYWQAHMDLIVDLPPFNLYDPEMAIYTAKERRPPAKIGPRAQVARSLISHGCIINGEVRNSVLSPGVYVEEGARVLDSIILDDSFVGRDAIVDRCIVDKDCWLGPGCHIGYGDDYTPNQQEPEHLNSGITLVGKGAKIRAGSKIGRNCRIGCAVELDDFDSDFIPSGATLERKTPKRYRV